MTMPYKIMETLSKKDAARVAAVFTMGEEVVDKNVTDFLTTRRHICKIPLKVTDSYYFKIATDKEVKKAVGSKSTFTYGYCDYNSKTIVLNLDHVLLSSVEDIVDTMLHECAHAVALHLFRDFGHGAGFRKISNIFGNEPRATSKVASEELSKKIAKAKKYKIVVLDDNKREVEVIGSVGRKLKDIQNRWAKNRKHTMGMLWLVKTEDFERYGNNFETISRVALR